MKKENWYFAIGGLAVGLVLVCVWFWTIGAPSWTMPMMSRFGFSERMNTRGSMMNDLDAHFLEQMVPHHADAVIMADLALEKAEHPELKSLATDIKTAQTAEIGQMKSWYSDWYGNNLPEDPDYMGHAMHHNASDLAASGSRMMMGGMMGTEMDTETLRNAKPFDKAFIEAMIPHHQMAVMMAEMVLAGSGREEVKDMARDIVKSQSAEIEKMRNWLSDWY